MTLKTRKPKDFHKILEIRTKKKCLLCADLERMTTGNNTEHGTLDLDNREWT